MLRQYAAAMLPDTRRVLGRVMRPFSLGHAFLLTRLGSPFMGGIDRAPLVGDLRLAMLVCSRPWEDAVRIVNSRWGAVRLLMMRVGLRRLVKGTEQFLAYMDAHKSAPDAFDPERTNGWRLRTPFLLQVKIVLRTEFGMTEREALALPLGQAYWEFMASQEMNGNKRLVGDEDVGAMKDVEAALVKFGPELKEFRERMASLNVKPEPGRN